MSIASPTVPTPFSPFRFALRELRGGLQGFRIFVACIALGVMAIAGVGSFSRSLTDGIDREGQVILGGDLSFILIHREVNDAERRFLESRGQVAASATMRAMASTAGGQRALVELKAVDGLYPLYGKVVLDPDVTLGSATAQRDGAYGAAVDSTLLARLNLERGARLTIGSATIEITAVIQSEPDKLASGIGFGPRIILSQDALRATGLLVPGSLVRWIYRVKLPDGANDDRATTALIDGARAAAPEAGWEVRSRSNASPQLERTINRFTQFLTLVGLAALLVGGVGVANAVKSHIDRRRDVIASFKALGATGVSFDTFVSLISDSGGSAKSVPLLGFAQAGAGGFFDDAGFPAGKGWDEIAFPAVTDEHAYALEISGDSMAPAYRDGDTILVSPAAPVRRGDRVVLKTRKGEVMVKELKRQSAKQVELRSLNPDHPERTIATHDVVWMARVVWASQ